MGHLVKFRDVDGNLPVLFTHVPKTGGSTITGGMATMVGRPNIAGISIATPEKRRAFLEECQAAGKRYVYGHFRYSDAAAVYNDANFIVSLRDPVDRVLSFYFMLLRGKNAFAQECAKDVSGAGFVMFHDRLIRRRRQDNLMCRYICDEPDHKQAIEVLRSRYCLAWDTEGTELAWRELHRRLKGTDPRVPTLGRRNDAPVAGSDGDFASGARPQDYSSFLPKENLDLVVEQNSEDILLFEWFQKLPNDSQAQDGANATRDGAADTDRSVQAGVR